MPPITNILICYLHLSRILILPFHALILMTFCNNMLYPQNWYNYRCFHCKIIMLISCKQYTAIFNYNISRSISKQVNWLYFRICPCIGYILKLGVFFIILNCIFISFMRIRTTFSCFYDSCITYSASFSSSLITIVFRII